MRDCSVNGLGKVDVVIPTRERANSRLVKSLNAMSCVGKIIVTTESPLSLARKHAVLAATTPWVAMVDVDVVLPNMWLTSMLAQIGPTVGAIASVALLGN
jgi:hypothetical protein